MKTHTATEISHRDVLGRIQDTSRQITSFLRDYCHTEFALSASLEAAIADALEDIGLQLRPFFLRISCEAGGIPFEDVLRIASGVELIQISTLVVDDVLDRSSMRNGRPSVLAKWGRGRAITCGTAIASKGMALICEGLKSRGDLKNAPPIMELVAHTHSEIYVGQFMDLDYEANVTISEEHYFETIQRTTASYIGAPLVIGAMLWDAPVAVLSTLKDVGRSLGLAYQLRDDIIDVIGESEFTGKPRAIDIRDRKMRLPVIHALANLDSTRREKLLATWIGDQELRDSQVHEVILMLKQSGSIEYCIGKVRDHCSEARRMVAKLAVTSNGLADQLRVVADLISEFDGA